MNLEATKSNAMRTTRQNHHTPIHNRRLALLLGLAGLLLGALSPARAATLTVVNLDDSGPGSLRQAIADAAPGDTIDFSVTGTITLTSGELAFGKDLSIVGPGSANLTISGNNASRVFDLGSGTIVLSGLTIANGKALEGGGVRTKTSNLTLTNCAVVANDASYGGGIHASSTLNIIDSLVSSNVTHNVAGGMYVYGAATLLRTTVANNTGDGIYAYVAGLSCLNCTVSGNSGAGVALVSASAVLDSSTVYGNVAQIWGNGTAAFGNCIVGGTPGGESGLGGTLESLDYNLIQNTNGCTITGDTAHNIYGKDPLLGPLADNGGPTPTHALLPGSPAIDSGSSGGLTTDQRGESRPCNFASTPDADDGSDIGAFEVQGRSVTTLDDGGPGSLRQAIADAAPGDTIDFAVTGTITLTNGELVIDKDLTIRGPGATNLTVSGNNASRVFRVASGTVNISRLTVANGSTSGNAGGIKNSGTLTVSDCVIANNSGGWCGGIFNGDGWFSHEWVPSRLTVLDCSFLGNSGSQGGAITCWGTTHTIVKNSTFSANTADGGGAIEVQIQGNLAVTNCTLSGNTGRVGAAIMNLSGRVSVSSSTIFSNHSSYVGGIQVDNSYWSETSTFLFDTILFGNDGADFEGPLNSLDFNLIGNTNGCTITGDTAHNIYGKDPLLGPLADNGGPTWTHALLPGSPAIDHGSSNGLTTDQRGLARSFDFPAYYDAADGSDIGAVEMQEAPQTGPVFVVNATDDSDDSVPGIAHCSLREAIHAANSTPGSNSIVFATTVPGVMTGVTGTVTLTNGQLSISEDLSVIGPGAKELTISGNDSSRIFHIPGPFLVTLSGLMLADGFAKGPNTGAGESYGGAIFSQGRLRLEQCILRDNAADESGGAVYHSSYSGGTLTVLESVLHNNEARSGVGGAICNSGLAAVIASCISSNQASGGGGIWGVFAGSDTRLTNTTISCNTASDTGGGLGFAIDSTLSADSCTICSNRAGAYGGGISLGGEYDDLFTLRNCIVAGNSALTSPDVSGPRELISGDFNLVQNTNGITIIGLTTHNLYNQDPKLGPLADLGGPTPTHALRFDSPAIDAGHSGGLTTDQRGLLRPIDDPTTPNADGGDGSDIGAYEADPNLRILAIEKADADIRLRFNTLFGLTYAVERTDSLVPPAVWTPVLGAEVVAGSGGTATVIDPAGGGAPQRFYRARNDSPQGGGESRSALNFDGGDRVIIADQPALNPSTMTVETWVNFERLAYGDGWSPTDSQLFVTKGGETTQGCYWFWQGGSSPRDIGLAFVIGPSHSSPALVGASVALQTDRWYHIAGTYDGSSMVLYLDGQMVASNQVGAAVIGNSSPLYLGFNDAWPFYLTGQMDDVRLWNYARTEAEIRAAMHSTLTGNEPGLAGCWDFNEPANSQIVRDRSPNGCHGQLGSSPALDGDDPTRVVRGPIR